MTGGSMVLNSTWVRAGGPPGSAVAGMNADEASDIRANWEFSERRALSPGMESCSGVTTVLNARSPGRGRRVKPQMKDKCPLMAQSGHTETICYLSASLIGRLGQALSD
jgi:hypothetical protein